MLTYSNFTPNFSIHFSALYENYTFIFKKIFILIYNLYPIALYWKLYIHYIYIYQSLFAIKLRKCSISSGDNFLNLGLANETTPTSISVALKSYEITVYRH